jgi:molecular chaperone GrpE
MSAEQETAPVEQPEEQVKESGSSEPPQSPKAGDSAAAEAVEKGSENEDYKDRYLRAMAEMANYQQRVKREKAQWTEDAVRSLAANMTDVFDSLETAIAMSEKHQGARDSNFFTGIKAVRDQFQTALAQRGVTRIAVEPGLEFNADEHEVLMVGESEDFVGERVGLVLRPGYKINSRVLRPAQIQLLKGTQPGGS